MQHRILLHHRHHRILLHHSIIAFCCTTGIITFCCTTASSHFVAPQRHAAPPESDRRAYSEHIRSFLSRSLVDVEFVRVSNSSEITSACSSVRMNNIVRGITAMPGMSQVNVALTNERIRLRVCESHLRLQVQISLMSNSSECRIRQS